MAPPRRYGEVVDAQRIVAAFKDSLVEIPTYANMKRLLERAALSAAKD